jgi:hypothetical protein
MNPAMAARSHPFGRWLVATRVTPNTVGGEPL